MNEAPATARDLLLTRASWFWWGIPLALGAVAVVWPPAKAVLLAIAFSWAGIGCLLNARRCGRFHCHLTGPLYLALGAVSALMGLGLIDPRWTWIAGTFAAGTAAAYLPELLGWRYFRR